MKLAELETPRLAIWGAGSEGQAAAQALRQRFRQKHFTILEEAQSELAPPLHKDPRIILRREPVTASILSEYDIIIRSPGISIYREAFIQARAAGVTFTSGTNIWFAENRDCRTICVTGSKGKSTTTHLIQHLLAAAGVTARLARNMGLPLVSSLERDASATFYVLELSSYQTSDLVGAPSVAVVLNLYPEHLDWHQSEEQYYRDKVRLLANASEARILNAEDERSRQYASLYGNATFFNSVAGFHHDATTLYHRHDPWVTLSDLRLLGAHNLSNICAALTAIVAAGVSLDQEIVRTALQQFSGLNHRLTRLGERDGVLYVNDSIATIPQATLAAVETFAGRPTTVLVGGYDRGLNQQQFAAALLRASPHAVITLPVTGLRLYEELLASRSASGAAASTIVRAAPDLEQAVAIARSLTPAGGVILLSPGAPSYNSHPNFIARGEAFAKAAALPFRKG